MERLLTKRQRQVLELMSEGKTRRQIAWELRISQCTVDNHINALRNRLDAQSGPHCVGRAYELGILA